MRTLTDHIVSGDQAVQLTVSVLDEPGQGGACHQYQITGPSGVQEFPGGGAYQYCNIAFQNGPIKEFGVNGITHEALLAINIDRLRSFQAGPYAGSDNAEALDHMEKALACLQRRTLARIKRGVEGTNAK
ncbi:MAG: hypothetical protein WBQ85_16495 [Candidatus Sulfotelmatobacter sp.]